MGAALSRGARGCLGKVSHKSERGTDREAKAGGMSFG